MDPLALAAAAGVRGHTPERLHGGDVSDVVRVGPVVVKTHPSPPTGLFPAEARGLARLRAAGARVPEVLHVEERGLVMAWCAPGPADPVALGEMLARLHTQTQPHHGSAHPLFLGPIPLRAREVDDARTHLVDDRLRPLVARTRKTLGALASRLERRLDTLTLPEEGAVVVHGDLWSGNVLHGVDGPVLIDPSAQAAERAYDLAMMQLFGGFSRRTWDAYEALRPIPDAVRRSLPAYRLVFLLVHVDLFGSGYVPGVAEALDALG